MNNFEVWRLQLRNLQWRNNVVYLFLYKIHIYIRNKLRKKILRFVLSFCNEISGKRRVFRCINPNLGAGCSMHSECSSQSGLLLAIGVHRGTWLPGESTSTFAASACMYIDARTRIARTHWTRLVRILACVYEHEVRYCQIAWHVVSMYSIVSSVTACEITWFRSDGYDPTYPFNEINNLPTN